MFGEVAVDLQQVGDDVGEVVIDIDITNALGVPASKVTLPVPPAVVVVLAAACETPHNWRAVACEITHGEALTRVTRRRSRDGGDAAST